MTTTSATDPKVKPPAKRSVLAGPLEAAGLLLTFASVLGFAGSWNCFVDLLAHFRVQYVLAIGIVVALALLVRAWRAVVIGLAVVAVNTAVIVPLYLPPGGTIDAEIPPLKIVSFNVLVVNHGKEETAAFVLEEQPDIVLLVEVDEAWISAMTTQLKGYRMVEGDGRANTFGIALFVREASTDLVVNKAERRDITSDVAQVEAVLARMHWHEQPLALLGVHACTPLTEQTATRRDAELAAAARWSIEQQTHGNAAIVIGDFNATPWSYAFRKLEQQGQLTNSQRGFGVQASFKSNWPPLFGIPIDHCLHSQELKTVERRVDPNDCGSDHRPLVVSIGWLE